MNLDFRHLQVVLSVAEAGSINRAAARLGIAQAGLTAQLRRIETSIGGPLFVRGASGVTLTPLGEHVVPRAREVISRFEHMIGASRAFANRADKATPLAIAGVSTAALPMLIAAVRDAAPDRDQVTHLVGTVKEFMDLCRSGRPDVALLSGSPEFGRKPLAEITSRQLISEPAFVGLADDHPLAARPELDLAELADEEWIAPREKSGSFDIPFRSLCEAAGFTPRCRHHGDDVATAAMLVKSGHAVAAFHPTSLLVPGVTLRPLAGNPLRRNLVLEWRNDSVLADVIDDIIAKVLKSYQQLIDDSPLYSAWCRDHGLSFST